MDPQTEMILRMIDDVRSVVARESAETRRLLSEGLADVRDQLKVANGRTRKNEDAIARLETRTEGMVCVEHAERFSALEEAVGRLKAPPAPAQDSPAAAQPPVNWRDSRVLAAGTVSVGAVVYSIVEFASKVLDKVEGFMR